MAQALQSKSGEINEKIYILFGDKILKIIEILKISSWVAVVIGLILIKE